MTVYVYVYVYVDVDVDVHIHMHTHTHSHWNIYIHVHNFRSHTVNRLYVNFKTRRCCVGRDAWKNIHTHT